jgi:hypothetical protein
VLNCIEELSPGYFVANFEYKNDNDVAVHIPVGPDNLLTGSGIDWENSDLQPTSFEPGGGSFRVYFDGTELSWTVASRDEDHKVSNAANANSSSTKCKKNLKSATVDTNLEEELAGPDELLVYPNPIIDRVHLALDGIENHEMIVLYDLTGKSHAIKSIMKRTNLLEIDMTEMASGPYFIRIIMEDSSISVPIIKQ